MLWRALEGGTASKIWVKTRKIVGSAALLFRLLSSFFTRVEWGGGSEAPTRRMARWGLQANRHGTSFIKLTSILVYVFTITFSHSCTGRRTLNRF